MEETTVEAMAGTAEGTSVEAMAEGTSRNGKAMTTTFWTIFRGSKDEAFGLCFCLTMAMSAYGTWNDLEDPAFLS